MGQLLGDRGQIEPIREHLLHLAQEQQHARAMSIVAAWYMEGQGLERDPDEAFKLFSAAALMGDAEAQYELARMHQEGIAVERDPLEAVRWMRQAADQGLVDAQVMLATIYLKGEVVKVNLEEARRLLQRVAETGDSLTLGRLAREIEGLGSSEHLREVATFLYKQSAEKTPIPGSILQQGAGVAPSLSMAMAAFELEQYEAARVHWMHLAERQQDPEAQYMLGHVFEHGLGVDVDLDKAEEWYAKSAGQGYEEAMRVFENMFDSAMEAYQRGDHSDALSGWERAARQGDVAAMFNAGLMYKRGEGSAKNVDRALDWWESAAEEGHARAQANAGRMYLLGDGVETDYRKARRWLLAASQQGDSESQFLLAQLHEEGLGVDLSPETAFVWYEKSARQGYGPAQNNLGALYARGDGVGRNAAWAVYWYARAARQEVPEAEANILAALERLMPLEVSVDLANIRSGPSLSADVVGQLEKGAPLYRLDQVEDDWFEVYVPDGHRLGFIAESVVGKAERPVSERVNSRFPPAPEPRAGYTTCATRCFNSDCFRTYSDGTQKRFQARRSWDPFRNQMAWDAGSC